MPPTSGQLNFLNLDTRGELAVSGITCRKERGYPKKASSASAEKLAVRSIRPQFSIPVLSNHFSAEAANIFTRYSKCNALKSVGFPGAKRKPPTTVTS